MRRVHASKHFMRLPLLVGGLLMVAGTQQVWAHQNPDNCVAASVIRMPVARDTNMDGYPETLVGGLSNLVQGETIFYRPEVWVPMAMQPDIEELARPEVDVVERRESERFPGLGEDADAPLVEGVPVGVLR